MDNNLKDYREKELKNFVIGNIFLIMVLTGVLDTLFGAVQNDTNGVLLEVGKEILAAGILSSILYSFVFIFDAVISGNWKDNICNLCRALPGEVIFDDIKHAKFHDKRFTREEVLAKYGDVYEQLEGLTGKLRKEKSNSIWYGIYRKHENVAKVFISNRDYRLCRDLCVVTIWIAIMYLFLCIFSVINFSFQILEILFVEWLLTNIAMRGKQKRLAYNVIATDIHTREDAGKRYGSYG